MIPSTSVSVPQEASNHDEFLMQQSLLFSDTLKDLKNLRKQLYSAAEYFEITHGKEEQKQLVVETLKDYAIKALVNTVDHLGSVAYKVNTFLDKKIDEMSGMELQLSCLEQRNRTCQEFISLGGLSQQSLVMEVPMYHKRYIIAVEGTTDEIAKTRLKYNSSNIHARFGLNQFKNGIQATEAEEHSSRFGEEAFRPSPRFTQRQGSYLFAMNTKPENGALLRSVSLLKRSKSPKSSNAKRRYPSEPRRTRSLSLHGERERDREMEQYSSKSKRLFKAMLSLRRSKKDDSLYKFLDEN